MAITDTCKLDPDVFSCLRSIKETTYFNKIKKLQLNCQKIIGAKNQFVEVIDSVT